jgi:hypothetical protein
LSTLAPGLPAGPYTFTVDGKFLVARASPTEFGVWSYPGLQRNKTIPLDPQFDQVLLAPDLTTLLVTWFGGQDTLAKTRPQAPSRPKRWRPDRFAFYNTVTHKMSQERVTGSFVTYGLSAGGHTFATSKLDGMVRLWNVPDATLLATIQILDDKGFWFASTPDGLYDGSPGSVDQVDVRLGVRTYPMSLFDSRLHYPNLVDSLLAGRRPKVSDAIKQAAAPGDR